MLKPRPHQLAILVDAPIVVSVACGMRAWGLGHGAGAATSLRRGRGGCGGGAAAAWQQRCHGRRLPLGSRPAACVRACARALPKASVRGRRAAGVGVLSEGGSESASCPHARSGYKKSAVHPRATGAVQGCAPGVRTRAHPILAASDANASSTLRACLSSVACSTVREADGRRGDALAAVTRARAKEGGVSPTSPAHLLLDVRLHGLAHLAAERDFLLELANTTLRPLRSHRQAGQLGSARLERRLALLGLLPQLQPQLGARRVRRDARGARRVALGEQVLGEGLVLTSALLLHRTDCATGHGGRGPAV